MELGRPVSRPALAAALIGELDRLYDALGVLRKMPGNGEQIYNLIYATYLDPVQRKHADLIDMLHVSSRTYYRLRTEAISIMSIRL